MDKSWETIYSTGENSELALSSKPNLSPWVTYCTPFGKSLACLRTVIFVEKGFVALSLSEF